MTLRPTKRAAGLTLGALTLFGVGTNVQAGWVLTVAALLGGIVVAGAVWPLRSLRDLEVTRTAPRRLRAGDPAPVTLSVRNTGRRTRALVRVSDDFLGPGAAVVPLLGPGTERAFEAVRSGARRGVHTEAVCTLETGAPFGVLVARRRLMVGSRTVVHPRTFPVPADALPGCAGQPSRAPSGDVAGVREYRPGDPANRIHWRSTARRGELVVRESEEDTAADLVVVAEAPPDADTADAVASVACSAALAGLAAGRCVDLLCARDGDAARTTATGHDTVLDWGARLAADILPLDGLLETLPAGSAVVCVLEATPRTAPAVRRLVALASSARLTVVLVDPRSPAEPPTPAALVAADSLRAAGADVHPTLAREVERCFTPSPVSS